MGYKWNTGSISWLIHRVTGIALTCYIFLHFYVLSHLRNPAEFDSLMGVMKNPFVRIGEAGLLALVVAHSLNGFRLTLIDVGAPTKLQKPLFWLAFIIGSIVFAFGAVPIIGGGH